MAENDNKTVMVHVRCSPVELEQWKAAAGYEPLSSYIRRMVNQAAEHAAETRRPA